jgi:N-acetylgalactosamine kinase
MTDRHGIMTPKQWLKVFNASESRTPRILSDIYGSDYPEIDSKRDVLTRMLREYTIEFGDEPVFIARAPGRVNIMGRHIDHQGGYGNMIAIDKDIFCVAGVRSDRIIKLRNLDKVNFPDRDFTIESTVTHYRGDWSAFVNSGELMEASRTSGGDWSQIAKAAIARFQTEFHGEHLKGMNIILSGDIPIASGLSSSSALLVAIAEAIVGMNGLLIPPQRFAELCAMGEWYVGTRGWAGDHAAMKFGKRGSVAQLEYYPIHVKRRAQFPDGCRLIICPSGIQARKTAEVKDVFNHRIACYILGREMLKREFPEYTSKIEYLRDYNTHHLNISFDRVYEMIGRLPESMDRETVLAEFSSGDMQQFKVLGNQCFKNYPVRPVVLFGLAEIERSLLAVELLDRGDMAALGQFMNISHDGDRVCRFTNDGMKLPFVPDYSDAFMRRKIKDAKKSPAKAALAQIPGSYSCSIEEIDRMIDIALSVPGVMGAQIAGAGLGGCIMALVEEGTLESLEKALIEQYFTPEAKTPGIFACHLTSGSGLLG